MIRHAFRHVFRRTAACLAVCGLALSAAPARAQMPADGGYFLVDTVLDGVAAGFTVPIFTHVEVAGGRMEVTFITYFGGDVFVCSQYGKCSQAVTALGLDFTVSGGEVDVTGREIRTGVEEGLSIDRPDVDLPYIISPMAEFIDGAAIDPIPEGFTLTRTGRRGAKTARFMRATLEEAKDAIAFAAIFEQSLVELDHCVVRQVTALRHKADRTPSEEEVLGAARYVGLLRALDHESGYWYMEPEKFPGTEDEMQRIGERFMIADMLVKSGMIFPDLDTGTAIKDVLAMLRSRYEEDLPGLYAETVAGNEEALIAAIGYLRKTRAFFEAQGTSGEDVVARICRSIVIDEP